MLKEIEFGAISKSWFDRKDHYKYYFSVWEKDEEDFTYLKSGKDDGRPVRFEFSQKTLTGDYNFSIGVCYLQALPGCCGVVVVSNVWTHSKGNGIPPSSDVFRECKEKLARDLGYSVMIATNDMSNIPSVCNMLKSKYRYADTFINKRTGHLVGIGIKKL